ncbi:uncharacterized protein BT62DRAFT_798660 [Guyanagaster necrorhizus]|uniref:Uncharacterized protein n=1 Tax=Guyanagaster necrorhizus TaxID=856835 RepID=A0A9P7VDX6_9AGAR|nr:uncharacterized protein BT62DRAFT_798660 [Guyanagaster necrorhizus MCA 3950]KAG7439126.1 hypothetical protein BT62DRAFT_798660 [Guyanagaster necrorhizus MCA 3950]
MSSSNHFDNDTAEMPYGFNFPDHPITHTIDSLPPYTNDPPPSSLEDRQSQFKTLRLAVLTFQRWKAANENARPYIEGEIVVSPNERQYLSVDQAVRKINEEVPWQYRIQRPDVSVLLRKNAPDRKLEWKLMKKGDIDGLWERWATEEVQIREAVRKERFFGAIDVAIVHCQLEMLAIQDVIKNWS